MFPNNRIFKYVNHVTPGWNHFWDQGHNLNNLGRGQLHNAIYNKYQGSGPKIFRSDYFIFPLYKLTLTMRPSDWGQYWPKD